MNYKFYVIVLAIPHNSPNNVASSDVFTCVKIKLISLSLSLSLSNRNSIEFVEQCVHLGTKIYSDISKKNIDDATNDLYMKTNNIMADFSYVQSSTLSV